MIIIYTIFYIEAEKLLPITHRLSTMEIVITWQVLQELIAFRTHLLQKMVILLEIK